MKIELMIWLVRLSYWIRSVVDQNQSSLTWLGLIKTSGLNRFDLIDHVWIFVTDFLQFLKHVQLLIYTYWMLAYNIVLQYYFDLDNNILPSSLIIRSFSEICIIISKLSFLIYLSIYLLLINVWRKNNYVSVSRKK